MKKASVEAPVHERFTVDYAPTGAACCKRCGNTIKLQAPRFKRKVPSPFHAGFDTQYSHLLCGIKWAQNWTDIHYLGALNWTDFVKGADNWDFELSLNDAKTQKLKRLLEAVWTVKVKLMEAAIPTATMVAILESNGFIKSSLKKLQTPVLCQLIGDFLLRGRVESCPVCENHTLVPAGNAYYCYGFLDCTTKCDFWISFCDVVEQLSPYGKKLTDSMKEVLRTRRTNFLIPPVFAKLDIWKKMSTLLKCLTEEYREFDFRAKAFSGIHKTSKDVEGSKTQKNKNANSSNPESDQVDQGAELICLEFTTLGSMPMSKHELGSLIVDHGGRWHNSVLSLENAPVGNRTIVLVDSDKWKMTRTGHHALNAMNSGAIVLKFQWLLDLLGFVYDENFSREIEKKKFDLFSLRRSETRTKLRLGKLMKKYRLDGCPAFDCPSYSKTGQGFASTALQPKILRKSRLLEIDAWFAHKDKGRIYQIYVDKQNNAFSVHLTYVNRTSGTNNFYILQMIEGFRLHRDGYGIKRSLKNSNFKSNSETGRKVKKEKIEIVNVDIYGTDDVDEKRSDDEIENRGGLGGGKVSESADDSEYQMEDSRVKRLITGKYVDNASLSEEDVEAIRKSKVSRFYVFKKWGRLGDDKARSNDASTQELEFEEAQNEFLTKFHQLTESNFYDRFKVPGKPGRYQCVELSGYQWPSEMRDQQDSSGPFKEHPTTSPSPSLLLKEDEEKKNVFLDKENDDLRENKENELETDRRTGRHLARAEGRAKGVAEDGKSKQKLASCKEEIGKEKNATLRKDKGSGFLDFKDMEEVRAMLAYIFSSEVVMSALSEMNVDCSKLDIYSLSTNQLNSAFKILSNAVVLIQEKKEIAKEISKLKKLRFKHKSANGNSRVQTNKVNSDEEIATKEFEITKLNKKLDGVTDCFYTCIPHKFKRGEVLKQIDTMKEINRLTFLIQDVMNTAISAKSICQTSGSLNSSVNSSINGSTVDYEALETARLNNHYKKLQCDISLLRDNNPKQLKMIQCIREMVEKGHAPTHNSFKIEIMHIYSLRPRVERDLERARSLGNRRLLWHGSRTSNFGGILEQGLKIAPEEAPASGYMFDKGVYFADLVSKSAQYCNASPDNQHAFLYLCEVALGNPYFRVEADEKAKKKIKDSSSPFNSTIGLGQHALDSNQFKILPSLDDEHLKIEDMHNLRSHTERNKELERTQVLVPCGEIVNCTLELQKKMKENSSVGKRAELLYNEYVVYDTAQIIPRYLVEVEFEFRSFDDLSSSGSDR